MSPSFCRFGKSRPWTCPSYPRLSVMPCISHNRACLRKECRPVLTSILLVHDLVHAKSRPLFLLSNCLTYSKFAPACACLRFFPISCYPLGNACSILDFQLTTFSSASGSLVWIPFRTAPARDTVVMQVQRAISRSMLPILCLLNRLCKCRLFRLLSPWKRYGHIEGLDWQCQQT